MARKKRGWHGSSRRHSEAARKGWRTRRNKYGRDGLTPKGLRAIQRAAKKR